MDEKTLDSFHAARNSALHEVKRLQNLAAAFDATGNENAAVTLWGMAYAIEDSVTLMDKSFGAMLHNSLVQAQQATANMILAALVIGEAGN